MLAESTKKIKEDTEDGEKRGGGCKEHTGLDHTEFGVREWHDEKLEAIVGDLSQFKASSRSGMAIYIVFRAAQHGGSPKILQHPSSCRAHNLILQWLSAWRPSG